MFWTVCMLTCAKALNSHLWLTMRVNASKKVKIKVVCSVALLSVDSVNQHAPRALQQKVQAFKEISVQSLTDY